MGTAGHIAKFESSNTIGDSIIFEDDGNVGIGTTIADELLQVAGNAKVDGTLFVGTVSSNSPLELQAPSGSTRIYIDDVTGNVGIGTVSPTNKLEVVGDVFIRGLLGVRGHFMRVSNSQDAFLSAFSLDANSSSHLSLVAQTSTRSQREWRIDNDGTAGGALQFYDASAGVDRMVIDSVGNVGIGTASPQSALQVSGYTQLDLTAGAPPATDCGTETEAGRMKFDPTADLLYICSGASGWVAK